MKAHTTQTPKKYEYHKVIQQNWGYGWDDVDFYECDSTGFIKDKETRDLFKENLRLYRTEPGQPVCRVIFRKEKISVINN